jgi:DNA polymerase-3 subunit delta
VRRWLRTGAGLMGKKLTPRAASALLGGVGPNILALQNELAKLAAYVEPEVTVTERDVAEMVAQARSRRAFDLGHAVARGDVSEALRLCEQMLLRGERREVIISVLALQVRQGWQIKRLHAEGAAEKEIARRTGLPDFVVRRSLSVLDRLSDESLARQLEVLYAADVESKTTSLRSQEEGPWLERVLVELCAGAGERQAAGG